MKAAIKVLERTDIRKWKGWQDCRGANSEDDFSESVENIVMGHGVRSGVSFFVKGYLESKNRWRM
jgi:hypothetical protein